MHTTRLSKYPGRALRAGGAALALLLAGCGGDRTTTDPESRSPALAWQQPGMHVRILNPGAKHLDAICTRDTFNRLFPSAVWFHEGDVVGMYNRQTTMSFLVVSETTFAHWNDELSAIAERLCHEKAHRADDLYEGDTWSELRDSSAPGLALDTHHFGTQPQDPKPHLGVVMTVAMGEPSSRATH